MYMYMYMYMYVYVYVYTYIYIVDFSTFSKYVDFSKCKHRIVEICIGACSMRPTIQISEIQKTHLGRSTIHQVTDNPDLSGHSHMKPVSHGWSNNAGLLIAT